MTKAPPRAVLPAAGNGPDAGDRLTPLRRIVLEKLREVAQPLSAYDLMAILGRDNGRRFNPTTVYRTLEFLIGVGLVTRIESRNAFIACRHPGDHHDCLFLICTDCGTAIEIADDRIASVLGEDAASIGFRPVRQVVELQGQCRSCAEHA